MYLFNTFWLYSKKLSGSEEKLMSPKYCFQLEDINKKDATGKLYEFCSILTSYSL